MIWMLFGHCFFDWKTGVFQKTVEEFIVSLRFCDIILEKHMFPFVVKFCLNT